MIKQVPNIITSLNLLSGSVAVLFAASGDLVAAAVFAFLGIFFDFFDGLAARLLKAHSDVGLEFDSLADMITSGLAPAIVMVQLLSRSITGEYLVISEIFSGSDWSVSSVSPLPLFGLLIAVASGYRLAKFNVDTRQTNSFIGLPTPANTLVVMSLPLILAFQSSDLIDAVVLNRWVLIGITILGSILLNIELPLFALKFKTWDVKTNLKRYIFLAIALVSIIFLKFSAIPIIIGIYILMSLVWKDEVIN